MSTETESRKEKECVFSDISNCGKGRYGESGLVKVSELDSDIEQHFKKLKISWDNIKLQYWKEKHLIENRSKRALSDDNQICQKHRETYGIHWRPSLVCQHPGNSNKRPRAARTAPANLIAKLEEDGIHLPIGSKLCESHYKYCTCMLSFLCILKLVLISYL